MKNIIKNPPCPSCKSNATCLIFWGEPDDYEWYLNAIAKKEIIPGVESEDAKWGCSDCKHRWGKRGYDEDEWGVTYDEEFPYTESANRRGLIKNE